MKVLQTHVLGCVYVILSNISIRLWNTQTHETVRETRYANTKHNKFNKEFTQSSWATSPSLAFSGGLFYYVLKHRFYNKELNLSLT